MHLSTNWIARVALGLFAASAAIGGANPELDRARRLYETTDFAQSLKILQAIPEKDAAVHELIGLNFYMEGEYKKASEAMEKAVAAAPENSDYVLWLARAFGRRAETSSPFTAPGLANKAHQHFEKAVQLDPANIEAVNDLFEYYLEAPGFLGGGMDKALALVPRITELSPVDGDGALSRIAEKKKEYTSAEAHLRRAIERAPRRIGAFIDLAKFLVKRGRYQEADQSLATAEKIAPDNPRLLYAKADVYIRSNRNLATAKQLLEKYLASSLTPDDPSRAEARKLLEKAHGG